MLALAAQWIVWRTGAAGCASSPERAACACPQPRFVTIYGSRGVLRTESRVLRAGYFVNSAIGPSSHGVPGTHDFAIGVLNPGRVSRIISEAAESNCLRFKMSSGLSYEIHFSDCSGEMYSKLLFRVVVFATLF